MYAKEASKNKLNRSCQFPNQYSRCLMHGEVLLSQLL